jgi:hypothetical protein
MALTGCADSPPSGHGAHFTEQQATKMFARFEQLRPPVSSAAAHRHFGDPSWTARADIFRLRMILGYIPLRSNFLSGSTFGIVLIQGRGEFSGYQIWLHATPDIISESDLRAFFAGVAPASARITEFALCYPDKSIRNFPDSVGRNRKQ